MNEFPHEDPLADADAGETPGAEPDPFAEVPPELGSEEELPQGVEQGSLGGVNPSEEAERIAAEEAAQAEFREGESAPEEEPFAEEPVDPLGGGGEEPADEVEPEPEPEPEPALGEEDTTGVEGSIHEPDPEPDPAADPGDAEPEPDSSPDPDPNGNGNGNGKPAKAKRKRRSKKEPGPGQRLYTILSLAERADDASVATSETLWKEEFEVVARGGELALRQAYRKLSDNAEGDFTLVAVPSKLFNPTRVQGKVPDAALAIKIG